MTLFALSLLCVTKENCAQKYCESQTVDIKYLSTFSSKLMYRIAKLFDFVRSLFLCTQNFCAYVYYTFLLAI